MESSGEQLRLSEEAKMPSCDPDWCLLRPGEVRFLTRPRTIRQRTHGEEKGKAVLLFQGSRDRGIWNFFFLPPHGKLVVAMTLDICKLSGKADQI